MYHILCLVKIQMSVIHVNKVYDTISDHGNILCIIWISDDNYDIIYDPDINSIIEKLIIIKYSLCRYYDNIRLS